MDIAELNNKVNNLIQIGTISEVKEDKALARVDLMGRVSDFLPVLSQSNEFKKHFIPARVGEQVVVLSPFGEASGGVILRGVFNKSLKEPQASKSKEVLEYEDGTKISYDTQAKELKVEASDKITIIAGGDVNITCSNATLKADKVLVDSPSVDLGGNGGKGVVTGDCLCPFTGSPHADLSGIVKAVK